MPSRFTSSPLASREPTVYVAREPSDSDPADTETQDTDAEDGPTELLDDGDPVIFAPESHEPEPLSPAASLPPISILHGIAPHLFPRMHRHRSQSVSSLDDSDPDLDQLAVVAQHQLVSTEKKLFVMEANLRASRSKLAQLVGLYDEMDASAAAACAGLVEEYHQMLDADQARIGMLRRELEGFHTPDTYPSSELSVRGHRYLE
ncbi:hypothetical protein C8R47DRAFT_1161994 [Mycena vitilis]|nr:hypothetical protein C8R47DRAFT_1161994 [Mycena vitilis]